MKQKKVPDLSSRPLQKPTFPEDFPFYQRKSLHLKSDSLSFQKIKRTNATAWSLSIQEMKNIKQVSQVLEKAADSNNKIQELFLIVEWDSDFTDKDLLYLVQGLKRLKSLQRLTLEIQSWTSITAHGSLSYSAAAVTNLGLGYLSQSLKKLRLLKSIKFERLQLRTGKGLRMLNGSLNRLSQLEEISITIPDTESQIDQSLERINFKRLVSLRKVDFSFERSEITDKGIYSLTQGLKELPNLQRVGLDMWKCCELSDLGLHYIWEMMKTLPCLREISLIFSECSKMTDAGLDDLNKILMECSVPLENFRLEFHDCDRITDAGITYLCQFLKRLIGLKSFYVACADCDITDFGVEKILDCISNNTEILKIGLDFRGSERITDTSLKAIIQYFKAQPSLENIMIGVEYTQETTEECKNEVYEELENLQKQRPYLEFTYMV